LAGIPAVLLAAALAQAANPQKADKQAPDLKITLEQPKGDPTLEEVNTGRHTLTVKFENAGKADVLLWPYLSLEVLDSEGKPVRRSMRIGRWGLRKSASIIEDITFLALKPGESKQYKIRLDGYAYDADAITGWRLPAAGEYRLVFHYKYNRDEAKKRYGKGCKTLENPDMPWNRALEVDRKLEAKLKVAASS
jgi:hypothetical protein